VACPSVRTKTQIILTKFSVLFIFVLFTSSSKAEVKSERLRSRDKTVIFCSATTYFINTPYYLTCFYFVEFFVLKWSVRPRVRAFSVANVADGLTGVTCSSCTKRRASSSWGL